MKLDFYRKPVIVFIILAVAAIFLYKASRTDTNGSPKKIFVTTNMILTSPSFKDNEFIPAKFACDGDPPAGGINPELQIQNVPENAKSLALIMDDPDATRGGTFTHWLVWNIGPQIKVIKEESVPPGSIEGMNDFGKIGYGGPCPPKGSTPHHYHFKLYALDAVSNLSQGENKDSLEAEIGEHLIAKAELVGLYQRK